MRAGFVSSIGMAVKGMRGHLHCAGRNSLSTNLYDHRHSRRCSLQHTLTLMENHCLRVSAPQR